MSDGPPDGPPAPGPEHALLKPFAGTFRATVKLWMGPGDPIVQHGTMINSFQVGGLYLFQDYTGDQVPGPWPSFIGKGFWGFNTFAKEFEGFWIDNASTMMQLEKGTVDPSGKVWTMGSRFVHPHFGREVAKRSVIRLIDNDHNDLTSFLTGPDGNEFKTMEILFERAKS